jgi:hypothetical protein
VSYGKEIFLRRLPGEVLAQEYQTPDNMKRITKIWNKALTEKVLAFQPPWARFTGSRR